MLFMQENRKVLEIPIGRINPNPSQPRRDFSQEELEGLAQSIRENGLLQPLTVRRVNGAYELISGERRLRACGLAGLRTVSCIIKECDNRQSAVLALLENLQRKDLQLFEQAEGIRHLVEDWNVTQEEAAMRLGMSQSALANKMRLLKLSPEERKRISAAGLTERHARALLRLAERNQREKVLEEIIRSDLNVRDTELLIEKCLEQNTAAKEKKISRFIVKDVRIFLNTIQHAVETMRNSGIHAVAEDRETEEYLEYVVRIPKREISRCAGKKPA